MAGKRNRSAQDTTLINLRALKARVSVLERKERQANRKYNKDRRAWLKLMEQSKADRRAWRKRQKRG